MPKLHFVRVLYGLGVWGYGVALRLAAALGHAKARAWCQGRKAQPPLLPAPAPGTLRVWMHCASRGEFEQGRPVLEELQRRMPGLEVVLTVFSPSGWGALERHPALWRGYLPLDHERRAQALISALKPHLAIWVKYELWLRTLGCLRAAGVPTVLVAAHVQPVRGMAWWLMRRAYPLFHQVFVQTAESVTHLQHMHASTPSVHVCGDTRADRVLKAAAEAQPVPFIDVWVNGHPCLVVGSAWPPDVRLCLAAAAVCKNWRVIVVPHEVSPRAVAQVLGLVRKQGLRAWCWSSQQPQPDAQVLVLDAVGLLMRLYRHATLVWVGGGYGAGIHNTLEPAAWGRRVLFGTRHQRFQEAGALIQAGAAASYKPDPAALVQEMKAAEAGDPAWLNAGQQARLYVERQAGAAACIANHMARLGLLPGAHPPYL